jgi:hypothetical protein
MKKSSEVSFFVISVQGKGPKRVGALYVTCQLFKVYFKVLFPWLNITSVLC